MNDHSTDISRRQSLKFLGALAAASALPVPTLLAATGRSTSNRFGTVLDWTPLPTPVEGFHLIADLATGGNTLLATHDQQAILIDTKFPRFGLALLQDARTLNNDSPDLALINTHHHGDHIGGNAFIIPQANQSFAHTNAVARIQSQIDQTIQQASSAAEEFVNNGASRQLIKLAQRTAALTDQINTDTVTPKDTFDHSATLKHAGTQVALHHFGSGHTDNDLVVHFENDNIIHTGDLIFAGLHPFFFPSGGATALGWIKSLKEIQKLTDKHTQIIPGHGQPGGPELIQTQIHYLEQLVDQVQKQIDAGTSKEDTAEMEWNFMNNLGFERIRPRAINAVYDELKG